jgi:hypothetical protein
MNRSHTNLIVDAVAFAAFVLLAATGILMRYVLPPGSGHFSTVWGMDRHEWGQIHFWIAVILTGVLTLHLLLHWSWIVGMIRGRAHQASAVRIALAIIGLLALAGITAAPFLAQVEYNGEPPHKMRSSQQPTGPTYQIDGSMTLHQVQERTGVPAAVILRELGLPPDLPADERLGRLRKQHEFQIHTVQEIVRKHRQQQSTEDGR